jgi:hypothetical protein
MEVNGIGGFSLVEGYKIAIFFANLLTAIILLQLIVITVLYVEIIEQHKGKL